MTTDLDSDYYDREKAYYYHTLNEFAELFLVFGSDIFIDLGQILKDKKAAKIIKVDSNEHILPF